MNRELHPANFVSLGEVMAFLDFSDEQINFVVNNAVLLSTMLQNDIDYAVHVMMQGYQISIGATRLATTNDDGYIDIYEFDDGNYQIVYEEFIKF
jgi:hypothetical protein